jgi:DNA (cytosine-5)-methyltransferase 1
MTPNLVLSIFPGIDLLGKAFEREAYCVVRGPDLLWGGKIESFFPVNRTFEGVIGGSPCQDFSKARRAEKTGEGERLLGEFVKVVERAAPEWFLLENVVGVPDVSPEGYRVQRLNLNALECGSPQRRLRCFQFGARDGTSLVIRGLSRPAKRRVTDLVDSPPAASQRDSPAAQSCGPDTPARCCMASEGTRKDRRDWSEFCVLQGLPPDFDLPGMSRSAKYRAVGNGVPLPMGRVIAHAVRTRFFRGALPVCICDCGRPVAGNGLHATAACRKRMERRRRDAAIVTGPGPDTPGLSHGQVETRGL